MAIFRVERGIDAYTSRSIRFPNGLFEKLAQLAQDNNISMNTLVLQCCKYALSSRKKESQEEEEKK